MSRTVRGLVVVAGAVTAVAEAVAAVFRWAAARRAAQAAAEQQQQQAPQRPSRPPPKEPAGEQIRDEGLAEARRNAGEP